MNIFRFVLPALALAAGIGFAQQPGKKEPPAKEAPKAAPKEPAKPAPGSLEDTLEKALRNSADIKAAEAKVRDAEAEANRVRSAVLTKATSLHTNLTVAKRMLEIAEEAFARARAGVDRGQLSQAELSAAMAAREKSRGEVEIIETELKSLRGEFAINRDVATLAFTPDGRLLDLFDVSPAMKLWSFRSGDVDRNSQALLLNRVFNPVAPPVQPAMADRIRKMLDTTIQTGFAGASPSDAVRQLVAGSETEVPVRVLIGKSNDQSLELQGSLAIGAWFQAIEDSDPNLRIVVRDYGLLLTTKDRVPDGAVRVADFWKAKEAKKDETPKK